MKVTYDSDGKVLVVLSGYLKTVGIEVDVSFDVASNGKFDIDLNADGKEVKLFDEAPALVALIEEDGFDQLKLMNPAVSYISC